MKFYEKVRPLRIQIESLGQRIDLLASDLRDKEEELVQEKLVSFNMTGLIHWVDAQFEFSNIKEGVCFYSCRPE